MLYVHMTKLGTIDLSSTPAEKFYFGSLAVFKLEKNLNGGRLKRFWRKKMFSPKSMSNLGRLTVDV